MSLFRSTRHSVYNLNYHVVVVTKHRKKIISEDIQIEVKALVEQIAVDRGWTILSQEVMEDHAHFFLSCPPKWSPADIVKIIKGVTAKKVMAKFPQVKAKHFWTNAYYVGSAGTVSKDTIRDYIERQKSA